MQLLGGNILEGDSCGMHKTLSSEGSVSSYHDGHISHKTAGCGLWWALRCNIGFVQARRELGSPASRYISKGHPSTGMVVYEKQLFFDMWFCLDEQVSDVLLVLTDFSVRCRVIPDFMCQVREASSTRLLVPWSLFVVRIRLSAVRHVGFRVLVVCCFALDDRASKVCGKPKVHYLRDARVAILQLETALEESLFMATSLMTRTSSLSILVQVA